MLFNSCPYNMRTRLSHTGDGKNGVFSEGGDW